MNGKAMSTMKPLGEALVDALEALLLRDEQNTCRHENTHRGGAIWEICDDCGVQWADDRGGKPEWKEPQEWVDARIVIHAARQRQSEVRFDEGVMEALRVTAGIDCEGLAAAREQARLALEGMERQRAHGAENETAG